MKGMGKAMMGTGEAEGEKRAEEATSAALLNPLIDEYSLKGAKGLLVNITGGSDLTLFEVEEAVNKIRAEVDPEAELIFGAIEDENLNGKIRVSIVATSLDGQEPETKPVVSMVHRIHNRNTGYNSKTTDALVMNNQATLEATEGATALDINQMKQQDEIKNKTNNQTLENVSIESATYMENTSNVEPDAKNENKMPNFEVDSIELADPKLFSDEENEDSINQDNNNEQELEMFKQSDPEEDFEIPAFLRRQKN